MALLGDAVAMGAAVELQAVRRIAAIPRIALRASRNAPFVLVIALRSLL